MERYYWLKLKKDFFKRHDIRIIESMPNGKDYIMFYLKLLCESVDHDGNLRFSDQIPYSEDMLAVVTNTNVDIVRSAIKVFIELNMMEIMDDGTFFMREVSKMLGSECESAERVRKYREQKLLQCNADVTEMKRMCNGEKDIEKDKEKEKDKEIYKEKEKENVTSSRFKKPTLEEVRAYCQERKNNVNPERWYDFYQAKGWKIGKDTMKDWKAAIRTWEQRDRKEKKEASFDLNEFFDKATQNQ